MPHATLIPRIVRCLRCYAKRAPHGRGLPICWWCRSDDRERVQRLYAAAPAAVKSVLETQLVPFQPCVGN
jgi:hypothetical protein